MRFRSRGGALKIERVKREGTVLSECGRVSWTSNYASPYVSVIHYLHLNFLRTAQTRPCLLIRARAWSVYSSVQPAMESLDFPMESRIHRLASSSFGKFKHGAIFVTWEFLFFVISPPNDGPFYLRVNILMTHSAVFCWKYVFIPFTTSKCTLFA